MTRCLHGSPIENCYDCLLEQATQERDHLRGLLREFVHCGVSFDDARISYVEMQVDRRLLADAKAALKDQEETHGT